MYRRAARTATGSSTKRRCLYRLWELITAIMKRGYRFNAERIE
jgi:hypothetical protein